MLYYSSEAKNRHPDVKDALPLILFVFFVIGLTGWFKKQRLVAFTLDESKQIAIFETYSFRDGKQVREVPLEGVDISIFHSFFDRLLYGSPVFFTLKKDGVKVKASYKEGFSTIVIQEMQSYLYQRTLLTVVN